MSHRTNKLRKPVGPRPLHYTFYQAGNATVNREMIRLSQTRTKIDSSNREFKRKSRYSLKFNKIKCQVKRIALRQYVERLVIYVMSHKHLYYKEIL